MERETQIQNNHPLRRVIYREFEAGKVCVFPNETIARFWLVDYAKYSEQGAIFADRAMAWDTFRGQFLPSYDSKKPSNKIIRRFFAQQFVATHPNLSWFNTESFPESRERFSRYLAGLLPTLSVVSAHPSYDKLPAALRYDTGLLFSAYQNFLADHNLFEPGYEKPSLEFANPTMPETQYVLCFSESIEGADELCAYLGNPKWITSLKIEDETLPLVKQFTYAKQELKQCFSQIEDILEQGASTSAVVITCASLESWRPYLEEEARLRAIPLTIYQGRSPLNYRGGALFRNIRQVYEHEFSLDAVKAFVLDPGFPWSQLPLQQTVIRTAIKLSIDIGSVRGGTDRWEQKLIGSQQRELKLWYHTFKHIIIGIAQAKTPDDLRKGINAFQDEFFLSGGMRQIGDALAADVYTFCIDRIEAVEQAYESAGMSGNLPIFDVYMSDLEQIEYIPKQDRTGIAVYPWGLSAGIVPPHHFMIGMTHDATGRVYNPLNWVHESVLEECEEQDITSVLLKLYGVSGQRCYWSCSQEDFTGSALPPSLLFESDNVERVKTWENTDRNHEEILFWRGLNTHKSASQVQKTWYEAAKNSVLSYTLERSDNYVSHLVSHTGLLAQTGREFSPTMVDTYRRCPFAWACTYVMKLPVELYEIEPLNHREMGIIIHRIYQETFSAIAELTGTFQKMHVSTYLDILTKSIETALADMEKSVSAPTAQANIWISNSIRANAPAILVQEAKKFDGYTSYAFEKKYSIDFGEHTLQGIIDRVLLKGSRSDYADPADYQFVVVDYKKGKVPSFTSPYADELSLSSVQLPMYQKLLNETDGAQVIAAGYYSFQEQKYSMAWEHETEKSDAYSKALDQVLSRIIENITKGDIMATPSAKRCERCAYRPVCRRRFVLQ